MFYVYFAAKLFNICSLFFFQCGVFSPTPRNHYLNITPKNVVKIYSNINGEPSTTIVNEFVADDFKVAAENSHTDFVIRSQDSHSSNESKAAPFTTFSSSSRPPSVASTPQRTPTVSIASSSTPQRFSKPSSKHKPTTTAVVFKPPSTSTVFGPKTPATPLVLKSRTFAHPKLSQNSPKPVTSSKSAAFSTGTANVLSEPAAISTVPVGKPASSSSSVNQPPTACFSTEQGKIMIIGVKIFFVSVNKPFCFFL